MLIYFDKLFAKIYYWYIAKNEKNIPALYSILIISLFQAFNVLSLIFLIGGVMYKRNWTFTTVEIIFVMALTLAVDYIRFYRVIGFKLLVQKYYSQESRKVGFHPALYFLLSILVLVILRLAGLYPDIK